jgi:hypothetical protein
MLAAMLSGQLALRPCSLCHLSLHSVSTAFLLWQLYSCSRCLAHNVFNINLLKEYYIQKSKEPKLYNKKELLKLVKDNKDQK